MIRPMAATAAEPVPAIAAKNSEVIIVTIPRPPVNLPVSKLETSISLLEIPPYPITSPAKVKRGTPSNGNELRP